jgi:hypothetical protein
VLFRRVVDQHVQIYKLFSLVTQLLRISVFWLLWLWVDSGDRGHGA